MQDCLIVNKPWQEEQVKQWLDEYHQIMDKLGPELLHCHPVTVYVIGTILAKGAAELIRRQENIKSVEIAEIAMKAAEALCELQAMRFAEKHEDYFKKCKECNTAGGYHTRECSKADTTKH
jgi:hypothetical protein